MDSSLTLAIATKYYSKCRTFIAAEEVHLAFIAAKAVVVLGGRIVKSRWYRNCLTENDSWSSCGHLRDILLYSKGLTQQ